MDIFPRQFHCGTLLPLGQQPMGKMASLYLTAQRKKDSYDNFLPLLGMQWLQAE